MSQTAKATVQQIDAALTRYYKLMGAKYGNQFSEYCEENGFDDLAEEMGTDATDCMLVDFDEEMPFKSEPADRSKAIFELLLKIYNKPDYDFLDYDNEFTALKISKDDFKINKDDIKHIRDVHCKQLATIFNGEMKDDPNIIKMLAIGEKKQVPYLLYLTDMFTRDRISAQILNKTNLRASDWVRRNKHCRDLAKNVNEAAKDAVQHAVTSFFHRIVPKLMLSATTQILDELERTARYISTQVDFVHNLAAGANGACPFQLDALIAYNKVERLEIVDDAVESDESDHSDDDEKVSGDATAFLDMLGNVKKKLKKEKLLHCVGVIDDEKKEKNVDRSTRAVRAYKTNYDNFRDTAIKKKYGGQEFEEYPRNHRLCSFIDRRKPAGNNNDIIVEDEIIFFEPPNNCNTIPHNNKALWYFDSSQTSIIPNIGYNESMKNAKKDIDECLNVDNINSGFAAKGALLMVSFHVDSVNSIRAYLYLNGQVSRFFGSDIIDVLPRYFENSKKNQKFAKSKHAKDLATNMKRKLRDLQFEAFYNEYKYKKK